MATSRIHILYNFQIRRHFFGVLVSEGPTIRVFQHWHSLEDPSCWHLGIIAVNYPTMARFGGVCYPSITVIPDVALTAFDTLVELTHAAEEPDSDNQ